MQTALETRHNSGTTSLKLGDRKADIARIAAYRKRTVHSLLLEAVDTFLAQEKARIEYEQQAIRSYENFQATGLGISLDDFSAWAESLDMENPLPFPKPTCHK